MKTVSFLLTLAVAVLFLCGISPVTADNPFPNVTFSSGTYDDTFAALPLLLADGTEWSPGSSLSFNATPIDQVTNSFEPIALADGTLWSPGDDLGFNVTPFAAVTLDTTPISLADGTQWSPGQDLGFDVTPLSAVTLDATPIALADGTLWSPGTSLGSFSSSVILSDGTSWPI